MVSFNNRKIDYMKMKSTNSVPVFADIEQITNEEEYLILNQSSIKHCILLS